MNRRSSLVLSLLVVGCSTPATNDTATLTHEVDTTSGFERIRVLGEADPWTLQPAYTVGSSGGVGEAAADEFGRISAVVLDAEMHLRVADALGYEVREFDSTGRHIRSFGRDGEGPGEFGSLSSIAWLGDRLLAQDFGNGRVGVFSPEGEWIEGRSGFGGLSGSPAWLRFHGLGDSLAIQFSMRRTDDGIQRLWIEHGREGIEREFAQRSIEVEPGVNIVCNRPDGGISVFSAPYSATVFQLPAGGGRAWVARSDAYRFSLIGQDGDTLRIVERMREPEPITDEEWAAGIQDYEDFREEWPSATCDPRSFDRPEFKGEFANAIQGTDGRLWVEVWTGAQTAWEVFSPEGRLLATTPGFAYSENVAPMMRSNAIAWVHTDDLGVAQVTVARVTEGR